jgi:hypothetical protein
MVEQLRDGEPWRRSHADAFWGEIAPCDHVIQIYDTDQKFIQILSQFVLGGLIAGDGVTVIATPQHLDALKIKLSLSGINTDDYLNTQYYPLVAHETLQKFMVNDLPDERLFNEIISRLISKVRGNKRKVRAFGEMVAVLWALGNREATVRLERLWNNFCENELFCLFCAYPKSGFSNDINTSLNYICSAHSKIVTPLREGSTELLYSRLRHKAPF